MRLRVLTPAKMEQVGETQMIILAIVLILVGSLVPGLDSRAKNAMIIIGIILLILAVVLIFMPVGDGYYNWPFVRRL